MPFLAFKLSMQHCVYASEAKTHTSHSQPLSLLARSGVRLQVVDGALWRCLSEARTGLVQQPKVCGTRQG